VKETTVVGRDPLKIHPLRKPSVFLVSLTSKHAAILAQTLDLPMV
jgi:hypothetical protein